MNKNIEKKILIIDDSKPTRMLIKQILAKTNYGFVIIEAIDGLDALKKIQKNTFHLIITDVYMPDMDGIELVQEIKKLSAPKPKVIVMSSNPKIKNAFTLTKLIEPDDFIDKIFIRELLPDLVKKKLHIGTPVRQL